MGAGLGLLVTILAATGGNLEKSFTTGIHASRAGRNFYLRCRSDVMFAISVVNYLLTVDDDPVATNAQAASDARPASHPTSAGDLGVGQANPCGGLRKY